MSSTNKVKLPIPQMVYGTFMMFLITMMIYEFIDPNQCNDITIATDKQKCEELTTMIFNSIPIAWGFFIGGGVLLYALAKHAERKGWSNQQ